MDDRRRRIDDAVRIGHLHAEALEVFLIDGVQELLLLREVRNPKSTPHPDPLPDRGGEGTGGGCQSDFVADAEFAELAQIREVILDRLVLGFEFQRRHEVFFTRIDAGWQC